MRKAKRTILIAMLICVVAVPVCSAQTARSKPKPKHPTTLELLDRYAETQDKIQSFRIVTETQAKGATNHPADSSSKGKTHYTVTHSDLRTDGKKASHAVAIPASIFRHGHILFKTPTQSTTNGMPDPP